MRFVNVGKSCSSIREEAFPGSPCVTNGHLWRGREDDANAAYAARGRDGAELEDEQQLGHGRYESDKWFGCDDAGVKMVDALATLELDSQ